MGDQYLGEIRMVGFNYAPAGWALCQGQSMSISQNAALFSLLGTQFGGNGTTTFNLPDLQGRCAIGQGNGANLSPVSVGQNGGQSNVAIGIANLPPHTHEVATPVSSVAGTSNTPVNNVQAVASAVAEPRSTSVTVNTYGSRSASPNVAAPYPTSPAGGGVPISVQSPYLCVNFIIALTGIFPSRS